MRGRVTSHDNSEVDSAGVNYAKETTDRWVDSAQRRIASRAAGIAVAVLGLGALVEALARNVGTAVPGLLILLCAVGLGTTLPLALPDATLGAATVIAAALLSLTVFHTLTVAGAAVQLIAAYRVGRHGRPAVAVVAVAAYLVSAATADHHGVRMISVLLAALVPAVALGGLTRRMHEEAAENRAAQQAVAGTLLEHTARGERARIARELHDVVAHHISMVSVQAESARLTTPGLPPIGAQRLSAIGDTARAALTEMRRLLGVLRADADSDGADRRPQPGLAQLTELLDQARDATGAGARLIVRGPPTTLDPGIELAAYRIVQEALTNARRHAPGAAVDVELHYSDTALHLLIRDNGPGPGDTAPVAGHGLLGMRERAAAVGGDLRTGPALAGGFLVNAHLPIEPEGMR
jgi:signal transduction histidine kinase